MRTVRRSGCAGGGSSALQARLKGSGIALAKVCQILSPPELSFAAGQISATVAGPVVERSFGLENITEGPSIH